MSYPSISYVHTSQREKPCLHILDELTSYTTSFAECGDSKAQMATSDPTHTWPPLPNCTHRNPRGQPTLKWHLFENPAKPANPHATSPQVATMVASTPSLRNTTKPATCNVALVPSLKPTTRNPRSHPHAAVPVVPYLNHATLNPRSHHMWRPIHVCTLCGFGTLFHQTTPPLNPLCHPLVAASLKLPSHPYVALPPPRDLLIITPLPKVPT